MKLLKGKRLESDASSWNNDSVYTEVSDLKMGQHSRRPLKKGSWNVARFIE